ncbi:hypothetical protein [Caulobacter sp. 17J65-9]|uniref:hypothetical protein n=1 Tax=Caulobacter sp. 17J65-9 TaxID=2709382 RepID=UPI0013C576F1|nr:hypothetical protein [Caulobacter sp. 17J65-9]NEX92279.1 hypothetical protein [Caulobacter sp. 17J65-9]
MLLAAAGLMAAMALGSVVVGKSPYLGLFQRHFIARRKWEPGWFWASVVQYALIALALAAFAILVPSA